MAPQNELLDTAERVAAILLENGVHALVIGAIALAAHRYIRFTRDIDLAVGGCRPYPHENLHAGVVESRV